MNTSEAEHAWQTAYDRHASARANDALIQSRWDAAYAAVQAEAPIPKAIEKFARHLQDADAIKRAISNSDHLDFDQKVKLIAELRDWKAREDVAAARHQVREIEEQADAVDEADALTALLKSSPPTYAALVVKLRALVSRFVTEGQGNSADDADAVSRALTEYGLFDPERLLLTVYHDALRLEGLDSPGLHAEPFDAGAWAAEFEALPGHELTRFGPAYHDAAFDGGISDADFSISDPEMIAACRQRLLESDPEYVARMEREMPGYMSKPFIAGEGFRFDELLCDYPVEAARMKELHQLRRAARRKGPAGKVKWDALAKWQRKAVIAFARKRDPL